MNPDDHLDSLALALVGASARRRRALAGGDHEASSSLLEAAAAIDPAWAGEARRRYPEARALAQAEGRRSRHWLAASSLPESLCALSDPPVGLWLEGHIGEGRRIAVVGSRRASGYGRRVARELGRALAEAGAVLVSGLAMGVDGEAHRGALEAGGESLAVLGSGLDHVGPACNRSLAREMVRRGGLLSEYPPALAGARQRFPERNRLIAGLVEDLVVIEAAARSGALLSARLAMEEGREVWAVPGSIYSPTSLGCNALIAAGARPLVSFDRFIEASVGHSGGCGQGLVDPDGDPVIDLLRAAALSTDELADTLKIELGVLGERLFDLELDGQLHRRADGRWEVF